MTMRWWGWLWDDYEDDYEIHASQWSQIYDLEQLWGECEHNRFALLKQNWGRNVSGPGLSGSVAAWDWTPEPSERAAMTEDYFGAVILSNPISVIPKCSFPCICSWWGHTLSTESSSHLIQGHFGAGGGAGKGSEGGEGPGTQVLRGAAEGAGRSAWRRLRSHFIALYNSLLRGCGQVGRIWSPR